MDNRQLDKDQVAGITIYGQQTIRQRQVVVSPPPWQQKAQKHRIWGLWPWHTTVY